LRERRRITFDHPVEHGIRDPGSRHPPALDNPAIAVISSHLEKAKQTR
jgi:hypothetical protein